MLNIVDLRKSHPTPQGAQPVLMGVDLSVALGETLALMGESGSGKSTLLHLIAGLDRFDAGEITIDGVALSTLSDAGRAELRRDRVGLVFQQFNLIPSLTVADNIGFQAELAGRLDPAWRDELIDRLGLGGLLQRYPEQLSGGQQQRVAIGRTLAGRPPLVLADEPTGNLDEAASDAALDLALELARSAGSAFVMATHSARLAARLQRQARLAGGKLSVETDAGARPASQSPEETAA